MSAWISGLIGGAIAIAVTGYVASQIGKSGPPGQLRFGRFMWGLAVVCLLFSFFPVAVTLAGNHEEFWAKLGLFLGFGAGAVYSFGEAAFVRGSFDDEGIAFSTPWTGQKNEKWSDLTSLDFNPSFAWYTLTFKSGKKVRLSQYLIGHLSAVETARAHSGLSVTGE